MVDGLLALFMSVSWYIGVGGPESTERMRGLLTGLGARVEGQDDLFMISDRFVALLAVDGQRCSHDLRVFGVEPRVSISISRPVHGSESGSGDVLSLVGAVTGHTTCDAALVWNGDTLVARRREGNWSVSKSMVDRLALDPSDLAYALGRYQEEEF